MSDFEGLEKAFHYFQIEDYNGAIREYSKLLVHSRQENHFAIYSNQGIAYLKIEKFTQAIQCFKLAVQRFPDQHEALHNLSMAYFCIGKEKEALECLTKCLNSNPDFLPAVCAKALALSNNHQSEQALDLLRIIKSDYILSSDLFKITEAFVCLKSGKFEKSISIYESFGNIPSELENYYSTSLFLYAKSLFEQRKYDLSIEYIEKSIRIVPSSEKYFAVSLLHFKVSSTLQIVKSNLQNSIKFDNNNFRAYEILGLLAVKQGEYGEAVKWLRKAVDCNSKFLRGRFNLGLTLLKQGELHEARRQFKILLEIESNHTQAQYAIEMLNLHLAAYPNEKLEVDLSTSKHIEGNLSVSMFSDKPELDINTMIHGFEHLFSDIKSVDTAEISSFVPIDNFSALNLDNETDIFNTKIEEEKVEVEINIYSLKDLQEYCKSGKIQDLKGVITLKLEESLDDEEFNQCFNMSREEFANLDLSIQKKKKIEVGLL